MSCHLLTPSSSSSSSSALAVVSSSSPIPPVPGSPSVRSAPDTGSYTHTSDSAGHYSLANPYRAKVLAARYLSILPTKEAKACVQTAADVLLESVSKSRRDDKKKALSEPPPPSSSSKVGSGGGRKSETTTPDRLSAALSAVDAAKASKANNASSSSPASSPPAASKATPDSPLILLPSPRLARDPGAAAGGGDEDEIGASSSSDDDDDGVSPLPKHFPLQSSDSPRTNSFSDRSADGSSNNKPSSHAGSSSDLGAGGRTASRSSRGSSRGGRRLDKAVSNGGLDVWSAAERLASAFDVEAEDGGRRVVEIELGLPNDFSLEYGPGDAIGIVVENDSRVVERVLAHLAKTHGTQPDDLVLFHDATTERRTGVDGGRYQGGGGGGGGGGDDDDDDDDCQRPVTVRQALSARVDLCAVVKKRALAALSEHASDPAERAALLALSSRASDNPALGRLHEILVSEQRLNVADVLELFPSCKPPLPALISMCTSIAPRYYSVTSSPLTKAGSLKLAFSVVDYSVPKAGASPGSRRRISGLATCYMEALVAPLLAGRRLSKDDSTYRPTLAIFPKPTKDFRVPANLKFPLLLVGPGTGVAPFMGFLEHRRLQKTSSLHTAATVCEGCWRGGFELEEGDVGVGAGDAEDFIGKQGIGEVHLYFGCRTERDWIYKAEMNKMAKEGELKALNVCFSREEGRPKQYVQDKMREDANARDIARIIMQEQGHVFICGDGTKMAKDVVACLVEILDKYGVEGGGKSAVENLKAKKRLLLDIWGTEGSEL